MGKSFWTKWKQTFSQFNPLLISYAQKYVCVNDGFHPPSHTKKYTLLLLQCHPEPTDLLKAC